MDFQNKSYEKSILENNNSLKSLFENKLSNFIFNFENDTTAVFEDNNFLEVMSIFHNNNELSFETLIDIVAIDYSEYGITEWNLSDANNKGYSRGIKQKSSGRFNYENIKTYQNQPKKRFGVIYNLLSVSHNTRINIKFYCKDDENPFLPSVTSIWSSANWYEREAYDLFGIVFNNHPDLRRLLTDYGFIGHPLRKDFPLIGNVEVNYDLNKERVIYQKTTIKPRVLIPKVIRKFDNIEENDD